MFDIDNPTPGDRVTLVYTEDGRWEPESVDTILAARLAVIDAGILEQHMRLTWRNADTYDRALAKERIAELEKARKATIKEVQGYGQTDDLRSVLDQLNRPAITA
jgi:hypothetical protein